MADVAEVKGLVKALNAAAAGQGTTQVRVRSHEFSKNLLTRLSRFLFSGPVGYLASSAEGSRCH
jgi:hypothetical protein